MCSICFCPFGRLVHLAFFISCLFVVLHLLSNVVSFLYLSSSCCTYILFTWPLFRSLCILSCVFCFTCSLHNRFSLLFFLSVPHIYSALVAPCSCRLGIFLHMHCLFALIWLLFSLLSPVILLVRVNTPVSQNIAATCLM